LFYVLDEQGYLNDALLTSPADALVIPMTEDFAPSIAFATALRSIGVRTQVYGEDKKFKAKMSYADKLGIPYVVLMGEDEIAQNKVTIRDMATGEQETLPPREAAEKVAAGVAPRHKERPINMEG